ncbi:hypothetical protein ACFQ07_05260, partial [Actinomadura adrarensis]
RAEPRRAPIAHPWARAVHEHTAWSLVDPGQNTTALREGSAAVAGKLASLTETAWADLADDPWLDTSLPRRFTKRTDWLLRTTLRDRLRDLSPAEAALLTLIPLVHCTHTTRALAGMRAIDPLKLEPVDDGGTYRRDYELFLQGQRELVSRACGQHLPDRQPAGHQIGWWLLHRWLA